MSRHRACLSIFAALLAAAPVAARSQSAASPPLTPAERALLTGALAERAAAGLDDTALEAAVIARAKMELGQRVRPSSVDPLWALSPPAHDVAQELASARARGELAGWLAGLPQPAARYRRLLAARTRYAAIVAAGGWPVVPASAPGRADGDDPQIAILRQRLSDEGYGPAAAASPARADPALAAALAAFQAHHGLPADGVLGPLTRAALNVPAEARLAQIDANLERWRWLPHSLPADRLMVDIAGASAVLLDKGHAALRMKVVVGDPGHRTPMFASKLTSVVFNPPWIPPDSIVTKEILPKAARDPGYLARNHFTYQEGRLVQTPGPWNALGKVKFDLPSPFGVYLHDTPTKSAFARQNRALSHGCMRLEKPRDLAILLLAPSGWTAERIDGAIAAGPTQRVELKKTTPLYVVYWTAAADAAGQVDFRPDVYGWDAALLNRLAQP